MSLDPTITFTKFVGILELVHINKDIDVRAHVDGNSAMANATADALGANSHAETTTQTTVVQGVGSSSSSESVSVADPLHTHYVW